MLSEVAHSLPNFLLRIHKQLPQALCVGRPCDHQLTPFLKFCHCKKRCVSKIIVHLYIRTKDRASFFQKCSGYTKALRPHLQRKHSTFVLEVKQYFCFAFLLVTAALPVFPQPLVITEQYL